MSLEATNRNPSGVAATHLKRSWLLPARLLWMVVTVLAVGLFIVGLPHRSADIQRSYRGDIQTDLLQNQSGAYVLSPWSGSTSARAGVLGRDTLLAVDGNAVEALSWNEVDALLAGPIGTSVRLDVRTGSFPARQVIVTRDSLQGRILEQWGLPSGFAVAFVLASETFFSLACLGVALVIVRHRSDDWMALLASAVLTMILIGLSPPVITLANEQEIPALNVWFALAFALLLLFFYLFPSGRLVPRGTIVLAGILTMWTILELFYPWLYPWKQPRRVFTWALIAWAATGALALSYRFRYRSDAAERQQIRWIVWGAIFCVLGMLIQILPNVPDFYGSTRVLYDFGLYPLGQLLKLTLPLAISFAILRYRLWDINLVVYRVLVYGSLTALTTIIYLVAVSIVVSIFRGLAAQWAFFLATGLVAILFEPLRQRLQRTVNRLMYGERDDPYAVLTRLSSALETTPTPDDVLPALATQIAQALKIPYVAIRLERNGGDCLAAAYGDAQPDLLSFPLVYQEESIGSLQLARRAPGEEFSRADRRLLENIAHHAGAAAQSVRLHTQLLRSRAQIVNEREGERLRIRRDLHDELGPILASQSLKLAAVRQMIRTAPEKAEDMVDELDQQSQETVGEIRRLVHGLRPPALDQLGLVEAVRDFVRHSESDGPDTYGLAFDFSAPSDGLPRLPAAVEVNAYRIVLEALSNVTRHAQAQKCAIRFQVEQDGNRPAALVIRISDNGVGIARRYRAGVGLRSMRERAEEIGGRLDIKRRQPRGTEVVAWLPLSL